ncbi:MAG: hypothetical protein ACI825_000438 [Planctomycetota bacterium]|jgi:hypothetical protein|uniref:lipocalin family protein n=1 Tax=Patiriisocius sp. Uisw_047 TaxID=3230969 RepID=UPI0039E9D86E
MKTINSLKAILVFVAIFSILSCKNDDTITDQTESLIGAWQRSDFSDQFEYILTFQPNANGFRTEVETNDEGQAISSARSFNWATNDSSLTIDYGGEIVTTAFSFNENGHLFLIDMTNLYFIKME